MLAALSAVLVAAAATKPAARASATRPLRYACASNLYNARKVLHYVARPSACTGSGKTLVNFRVDDPVYTCRKEHGGFAARQRRFQFAPGIRGHGPAGLMRLVKSLGDCAPNSQPNETPVALPRTTARPFCAAKQGGELRWVNNTNQCDRKEFPVLLAKSTGNPVASPDSAGTDEDHGTNVSVLSNDKNTPTSNSHAGLQIASTDTAGTKGTVTVNPDGTISYSPNGQFESLKVGQSTTDTFKYRAKRGTHTSAPATVTITVAGVNDLPVAHDDTGSTDSAHTVGIPVRSNDTDADGDALTVTLDTSGTQGNVTVNGNDPVVYDPNHKFDSLGPNDTAHDSFKYTVSDGHGNSNQATVDVTIAGVDDPPVVKTTSGSTAYTEGDPAKVVDGGVTVSDPDSANLQSARISISDGLNINDTLELPTPAPGGITGFYDTSTGVMSLTGDASKADWQAALRTVQFHSNSDNPFPTKKLDFTVNDGHSDSAISTKTITTTNVNDPPSLTTTGGTADFTEDSPPVAVDPSIDVSDPDSLQFQSATVSITQNFSSADGDTLGFTDQNGIHGSYDSTTGVLTLTGTAAISDYQAAIQSVTFSNTSNTPSTADRTVSFQVKDTDGLASNNPGADSRTVTVTAHNDAPVNNLPAAQSLNEDGSLTLTGATKPSVSDADAGSDPIKVDLTVSHGKLDLSGTAGLTVTGDGTAAVSATGSQSAINTALDGLKYTPNANYNGPESLGITSDDQGHNPAPAQSTSSSLAITVNAVNDGPVNTVPGAQVTNEDTAITFTGATKPSVGDLDAGSDPIKVDLSVLNGKLDLSGTTGLTVTGNGTAVVNVIGSQSDINTALDGLKYTPDANYHGSDTLQIVSNDQGKNGSGGALSDTDTVGITVNAVNDAPINSLPAPQSTNEDTALTLTGASKLSVSDADAGSDPIKVDLTVSHGKLDLSGTAGLTVTGDGTAAVSATGSQSAINTALDGLKYTPAANFNSSDSIHMVTDDQGHDPAPAQTDTDDLAITVTAVNDAPVNTVPAPQSTNEDTALTLSGVNAPSVADADAGSDEIKVTLSAANGTLTLSGTSGLTVTGDGTKTVEAKGSQSDINTALDGLKYTPDANSNGGDSITMVSNDQGHNPAPAQETTSAITVTVNAVNDAPVNTVPIAQTTDEDTPLTFSSGNGNAVSVADADAGSSPVTVALSVSNGTLTLSGTAGLTVTGNGTALVNVTGSQGDIDTALNGLQYSPNANSNGSDTLHVDTNDNGNTGSGGALTDSDTVDITVNAVNDAPGVAVPAAQSTNEDNALTFSTANANPITVSDVDAGASGITVTLKVGHGTLSLAGTSGLTVSGNGTGTVIASGTTSNLNSALDGLVYNPSQDFSSSDSLQVKAEDNGNTGSGGAKTTTDATAITVNPVNDPPVVDLNGTGSGTDSTASFAEAAALTPVPLAPSGTVEDVDSAQLKSLTVELTNPQDGTSGDAESLAANAGSTGLTVDAYNSTTHLLVIHGLGTAADYQTVLQSVTYSDSAHPPTATPDRIITFVARDSADVDSTPSTATVSVVPIDAPPAVDLNGAGAGIDNSASFTEDQPAVAIAPSADVTDIDDTHLESATVTVTNHPDGGTELLAGSTAGTSGITIDAYNSTTGVLFIHGHATLADYRTVLRSVTYNNSSNTPDLTQRDISVVVNDGQANSPTATSHVSVTAHDDAPTLDLNNTDPSLNATASFTEDQPSPTTLAPNAATADVDSTNLQSATITLTNPLDTTAESLSVDTSGTLISAGGGYNSGTGVLTLSGSDTLANYQKVLRTIGYNNTSQNANTTNRVVNFVVNDGSSNSNSPTATVTIHVINDPPVVDMNGAGSGIDSGPVAFTEDSSPTVVGSGPVNLGSSATVTDVDNATLSKVTLTLTNHPDGVNESLAVTIPGGNPITTGGYNATTGELLLTGNGATLAQFQTVIQSAKYNNVSNTPDQTQRDVTIVANDGTANSTPAAHTLIDVTATNDAPTATAKSFTGGNSAVGNTTFVLNDSTDGAPSTQDPTDTSVAADQRPHKTLNSSVLTGSTDAEGNTITVASAGTSASGGTNGATEDGGTVTVQSDGDVVVEPKASTSCTDHSDSFTYKVQDNGSPSGTSTSTVSFDIAGCVYYVNNNDAEGNSGTAAAPYDTIAQAESASNTTAGDVFVYKGDGSTTGYDNGLNLTANHKLVGQAAGLVVGTDTLSSGDSTKRPTITHLNHDVVVLASGSAVQGVNIDPFGTGGGIFGGATVNSSTLSDVTIIDTGPVGGPQLAGTQPSLELNGTTGTFNISNLTVDNTAATGTTSGSEGVLLNNAGTVNFADSGKISINSKGAKGLDATSTNMGSGSVFDDITVSGSGSGGVNLNGTTGTTQLGDGSLTDLSLTTTSGAPAALAVANAGTVSVPSGGIANLNATGGPAADITGTSGATFDLDTVSSSNSANDGVNISGLGAGSFTATAGAIGGQSGIGFDLDGGNGTITYPGAFNDTASGTTAEITNRTAGANSNVTFTGNVNDTTANAGGGINEGSNSGGNVTFSGATKKLDTGAGNGVTIAMPNGSTASSIFSGGGLDIDTTTGKGFETTGVDGNDGNVQVSTGANANTIDTGSGKSLNITNSNPDATGVTFQHISGNGANAGILLNNTGSNNALTVASDGTGACKTSPSGANCTGGQIQNTTGADDSGTTPAGTAVVLNNTKGVSLTRMLIHDNSNYAIRGNSVTGGFIFDNSTINGANGTEAPSSAGSPFNESAIRFTGLTGSGNAITNSAISGGVTDNVGVINSSGTLNRLTIQNDLFGNNSATQGNRNIDFSGTGSSTMNVTVDNSTFTASASHDFGYDETGTAGDVIFTNNNISQSRPVSGPGAPATGAGNVKLTSGAGANVTFNVASNTMTGATGNAMLYVHDVGDGDLSGIVNNNIIGTAGTANSGSLEGDGIQLNATGGTAGANTSIAITGNQVRQYNNFGIELASGSSGLASETGNVSATVTGNTVANPGNNASIGSIFQGVQLNTATVDGQSFQWCLNVKGNSILNSGRNTGTDFRLRQRFDTKVVLPGYGGTAFDTAAVTSFIANQNDAAPNDPAANAPLPTGASLTDAPSGGQGFVGGAACASG